MGVSRYASLGSLTLASLIPIGASILWKRGDVPLPYLAALTATSAIIIWAHRPNIRRLLQGTERKIGQRVSPQSARQAPVQKDEKPPEGNRMSSA